MPLAKLYRKWRPYCAAGAAAALVLAFAGCSDTHKGSADLVNGKKLFIGQGTCGSCHTLQRAGTKGTQGPNLDEAFANARQEGMGESVIQGVVAEQIQHPRRGSIMPPDLVKGKNVNDVAAYVASVAGTNSSSAAAASGGTTKSTNGKAIFTSSCASCHTLAAAGTSGTVGPNLDQLKPAFAVVKRQVENGGAIMPAFKGKLTDAQIATVSKYVAAQAGKK